MKPILARSGFPYITPNWDHPVFYGAFRGFFLLAGGSSILLALGWFFIWNYGIALPGQEWGIVVWHGHEMVFGFVIAALFGFLLTAVPEFTETASVRPVAYFPILVLWILARFVVFLPGSLGNILSLGCDLGILGLAMWIVIPPLLGKMGKDQRSFGYAVGLMFLVVLGYHSSVLLGKNPLAWIRLSVGVWMILIIVSMSRISMRIINSALDLYPGIEERYIARPPRRNFAVFCITLFSFSEFLGLSNQVQGWLALASMSGVFFLLNDWHIGKVVFNRWVFLLYSVYWWMGIGYGGVAYSLFSDVGLLSTARHILFMGAIGGSVFVVMLISGRSHSGRALDERIWAPIAYLSLSISIVLRVLWGLQRETGILLGSTFFWCLGFGLYLVYFTSILTGARPDGKMDDSSTDEIDCKV